MKQARQYRRLPGRAKNLGASTSLWLAHDHILKVTFTLYVENYKRYYLKDIQAIIITPNRHGLIINLIALFINALLTTVIYASNSNELDDALPYIIGFTTPVWVILLINVLMGQTCTCQIKTAVQTDTLNCVQRNRTAQKLLRKIIGPIEAAQADLLPPEDEPLSAEDNSPAAALPPLAAEPVITPLPLSEFHDGENVSEKLAAQFDATNLLALAPPDLPSDVQLDTRWPSMTITQAEKFRRELKLSQMFLLLFSVSGVANICLPNHHSITTLTVMSLVLAIAVVGVFVSYFWLREKTNGSLKKLLRSTAFVATLQLFVVYCLMFYSIIRSTYQETSPSNAHLPDQADSTLFGHPIVMIPLLAVGLATILCGVMTLLRLSRFINQPPENTAAQAAASSQKPQQTETLARQEL